MVRSFVRRLAWLVYCLPPCTALGCSKQNFRTLFLPYIVVWSASCVRRRRADAVPMPRRHRAWLPPAHCSRGRTWRPPRRKRPFALSSIAKLDPRMQGSYSLCRHYTTAQRCVFASFLSGGFMYYCHRSKGQLISKAIYGLLTSPKK